MFVRFNPYTFMQIYSESHNDPSFIDAMTIVNELEIHTY